jgi:hypothetical protein
MTLESRNWRTWLQWHEQLKGGLALQVVLKHDTGVMALEASVYSPGYRWEMTSIELIDL